MSFDTFLSYNSKDLEEANILAAYLENSGIRTFYDRTTILPGMRFQKSLEKALRESSSMIILLGKHGVGPWQESENYIFEIISKAHRDELPIIPVLLPGAHIEFFDDYPEFLRQYSAYEIGDDLENPKALFKLLECIPNYFSSADEFERPILDEEENSLIRSSVQFYENNAELYFERWRDNLPGSPLAAFVQELRAISSNPVVLDAGCGPGHHGKFLKKEGVKKIYGVDLSRHFLRIAEANKTDGLYYQHGDIRLIHTLYNKRNMFDGIWACGSCLHLPQESLERQLYKFLAVLRPKGILNLSLQVDSPSIIQADGRLFERYVLDDLRRRVERVGFRILQESSYYGGRSTEDKKKVKKWHHLTLLSPSEKNYLKKS